MVKRGFDLKGYCSEAVLGNQVKYGELLLPIPLARSSQRHTTQPTLISPTRNPTRKSNKGFDWSNEVQPARWPITLIERNLLSELMAPSRQKDATIPRVPGGDTAISSSFASFSFQIVNDLFFGLYKKRYSVL